MSHVPLTGTDAPPHVARLIAIVLFISTFVAFHDLSFPQSLITGTVSDERMLADNAADGSVLRQLFIPPIGLLGSYLLAQRWHRFSAMSSLGLVLVVYVAWAVLSLSWSETPDLTLRRLSVFLILIIGAVGVATLGTGTIRNIVVFLMLANLGVGFLNELRLGTFTPFSADYRFSGTVHPNLQASVMAQMAIAGLAGLLEPSGRRRPTPLALFLLGAAVVLMTQSRTSLICLSLTSLFMVVLWSWRRAGAALLLVVALLGVTASVVMLSEAVSPQTSAVSGVLSALEKPRDEGNIGSLTGRTDIWETCISLAMARPASGVGFESFWTPQRIMEISALHQWGINQAHSTYIEHLVSLGLIGLGLWVLVLGLGLGAAVRHYAAARSADALWMAGFIAFSVAHGFNESINIMPEFGGFVLILILSHLAWQRNPTEEGTRCPE